MGPSHRVGLGAVALLLWVAFAAVAVLVELRGDEADIRVLVELHDVVGSSAQDAWVLVGDLTDLRSLAFAAVAVVLGLLLAGRSGDAVFFVVSVAGVWLVNPLLKDLYERPRPGLWPSPGPVSEFSFPSGHAADTAALVVAIVLALPEGRWRTLAVIVGSAALVVVAFSQLALGVHHPSDILAGWLWAGAWVTSVWAVGSRARRA